MGAALRGGYNPASIRTLWAIAKSPELGMSDDDLHALAYRETGKASLRTLSQGEINTLARVLQNMKDGTRNAPAPQRTDEGGDVRTVKLRRKIYVLCDKLGWNDDPRRIVGFIQRMCHVDQVKWLTPEQCHQVIEGLKGIQARQIVERMANEK